MYYQRPSITSSALNYFSVPGLGDTYQDNFLEMITEEVAKLFYIDKDLLHVKNRTTPVKFARWIIWKILRSRGYSLPVCGKLLGGHDHTTVVNAMNNIDRDIQRIDYVGRAWDRVKHHCGQSKENYYE